MPSLAWNAEVLKNTGEVYNPFHLPDWGLPGDGCSLPSLHACRARPAAGCQASSDERQSPSVERRTSSIGCRVYARARVVDFAREM